MRLNRSSDFVCTKIHEISNVIRIAAVALCMTLLVSCDDPSGQATLVHTHVTQANELWAQVSDGESVRLLEAAQAYRPLLSPDGHWLAVEVMQMSDLHVVRLFRREGDTLVAANSDVTATAWQMVAAHSNLQLDGLVQPRTHVAGWDSDAHTLHLALSATIPESEQPFETIITVPLDQEP
jgi:hypothetical protein